MTGAVEAPPRWRQVWPVRLVGLVLLAALIVALVLLLIHIQIAGG